jgi:hypothetical protein
MASAWSKKRVLITVRTYPVPARKNIEVSCTAGVTEDGRWMRLFPVPYRLLDHDKQFTKYQWIQADVMKAPADPRPESHKLNEDTIQTGAKVSSADGWRARKEILKPLMRPSMCAIKREADANGHPTLGLFKPASIKRLILEADDPAWTAEESAALKQEDMFKKAPAQELEKIPYNFKYEYRCADAECTGHTMTCFDWEVCQSYRQWKRDYGSDWEGKFRLRYEREMISKYDTHFFVGNMHRHPTSWIIVGLFYPPKQAMDDLFGS